MRNYNSNKQLPSKLLLLIIPISIVSLLNIYFVSKIAIDKDINIIQTVNKVHGIKDDKIDEELFLREFLSVNPNYLPGLISITKLEIELGKLSDAKYYFQKIKEIDPNNSEVKSLEKALE